MFSITVRKICCRRETQRSCKEERGELLFSGDKPQHLLKAFLVFIILDIKELFVSPEQMINVLRKCWKKGRKNSVKTGALSSTLMFLAMSHSHLLCALCRYSLCTAHSSRALQHHKSHCKAQKCPLQHLCNQTSHGCFYRCNNRTANINSLTYISP